MSEVKTAIILAGGRGARLKPYTISFPKPLMPIGDWPILEVIVRQLKSHGFQKLIFAVNHQANLIRAYFESGEKWGVEIQYSYEEFPLGTMGPLRQISDLPEHFLVMNGDILTHLDYSGFFEAHIKSGAIFTISSYRREDQSQYGVLEINETNQLTNFLEKPMLFVNVSMGIYAMSRRVLEFIPKGKPFGFDHLMLDLIRAQQFPSVRQFQGKWLDIGIATDYERATETFLENKTLFLKDL